jgi:uncharacterized spore protein YtfJ
MRSKCTDQTPYALSNETVQGDPILVGEREIIPIVQVTAYAHRRALVGDRQLSGQGGGFVRLKPVAIIERGPAGERRIPIRDETVQLLGAFLLTALIVPLILMLAVQLMRKR